MVSTTDDNLINYGPHWLQSVTNSNTVLHNVLFSTRYYNVLQRFNSPAKC